MLRIIIEECETARENKKLKLKLKVVSFGNEIKAKIRKKKVVVVSTKKIQFTSSAPRSFINKMTNYNGMVIKTIHSVLFLVLTKY